MGLDEHADIEVDAELLGEVVDPLRLALAAAIGEEDEGDVGCLEGFEGGGGVW